MTHLRHALVAVAALTLLAGCGEEDDGATSFIASAVTNPSAADFTPPPAVPTSLTCPNSMRGLGNVPFRDEFSGGAATPEEAVEAWLAGGELGPEYVMDSNKEHAWVLRADGTAEARIMVKLTEGGYFYYGHEACGESD